MPEPLSPNTSNEFLNSYRHDKGLEGPATPGTMKTFNRLAEEPKTPTKEEATKLYDQRHKLPADIKPEEEKGKTKKTRGKVTAEAKPKDTNEKGARRKLKFKAGNPSSTLQINPASPSRKAISSLNGGGGREGKD